MSKIIVIEGTDCSGKETQAKLLEEKLKKLGKRVAMFSFPMYDTPTGKIVGGPLLGKPEICKSYFDNPSTLDPKIFSLYLAIDRKYNIDKIRKYLDDDYIVILDRYVSSNMAHQGGKIMDESERFKLYNWIETLEYGLLELPKPDLTLFLHMPYEQACILKQNRVNLDEVEKNEEYLINSEKTYLELSEIYDFKTIECVIENKIRTIDDINDELFNIVKEFLDNKRLILHN